MEKAVKVVFLKGWGFQGCPCWCDRDPEGCLQSQGAGAVKGSWLQGQHNCLCSQRGSAPTATVCLKGWEEEEAVQKLTQEALCVKRWSTEKGTWSYCREGDTFKILKQMLFLHFINILTQLQDYPMWNHSAIFFFFPMQWSSVLLLNNFHSCVFHTTHSDQLHWFIGNKIQNFSILSVS